MNDPRFPPVLALAALRMRDADRVVLDAENLYETPDGEGVVILDHDTVAAYDRGELRACAVGHLYIAGALLRLTEQDVVAELEGIGLRHPLGALTEMLADEGAEAVADFLDAESVRLMHAMEANG